MVAIPPGGPMTRDQREPHAYRSDVVFTPAVKEAQRRRGSRTAYAGRMARRDFEAAFRGCDLIATPTMPEPAFGIGSRTDDPLKMYLSDVYTVSANLAGLPAVSLPCGFTASGLPVGVQVVGAPRADAEVIAGAKVLEDILGLRGQTPIDPRVKK